MQIRFVPLAFVLSLTGVFPLAASEPALPPVHQSGTAMLAEGGGKKAGCVRCSYSIVADGTKKYPDRVRLVFLFRNDCQRAVFVRMATQTGYRNVAGYSNGLQLLPGETKGGLTETTNLLFSPSFDHYLNFWVFQSNLKFNNKNGNMQNLSRCNPGFKPGKDASKYPPCPPKFSHK